MSVSEIMKTRDPVHERRLLGEVLKRLDVVGGPDSRGNYTCWCPFHPDGKGRSPHQPNLKVSERVFICHACGEKGGLSKLARHLGINANSKDEGFEAIYDYHNEDARVIHQVVRARGKRFHQRRPDGNGGWIRNLKGTRRVIYRLQDVISEPRKKIFIVEGEKDADTLYNDDLVATTNPGGAGKWRSEYSEFLRGRDVVILPDNDEPGRKHAEQVACSLSGVARSVKVVHLPGLAEKGDVSDWLAGGHSVEELKQLADACQEWEDDHKKSNAETASGEGCRNHAGSTCLILDLIKDEGIVLFHDQRKEPYAAVSSRGGRRVLHVGSRQFGLWLARLLWQKGQRPLGREALANIKQVFGGIACFEGPCHSLHVRVANLDGAIWIDLDGHRAIKVMPGRWEVIEDPPIIFRSLPQQCSLPDPVRGGDPRKLFDFLNLSDVDTGLLLLPYLTAAFVPAIPIPVLAVHGVQGCGKTTFVKMVKGLLVS